MRRFIVSGLVLTVLGCQADIDVLTGLMTWPVGHVQHEASNLGRLVNSIDEVGDLPGQSPA